MCVLECIRQSVCVCVCVSWNGVEEPVRGTGLRVEGRGTGSRNGVEGRGLELRVEGWRMYELESEYEITRRRYSSSLGHLKFTFHKSLTQFERNSSVSQW